MKTEARPEGREERSAAWARARLLDPLPVAERQYSLAGISTAVLEGGEGAPVVLLHGPGEFAANWMRVIPDLVADHRVIAPDLPGHGSSVVEQGSLDVERALRWLEQLIERTCDSPPAVVGHVLGGALAARFAARHSDRLSRLVLVDSLGLAPFRPAPMFGLTMMHYMLQPNERTYGRFMRHCSADLGGLQQDMGEQWEPFMTYNVSSAGSSETKSAVWALMRRVGLAPIPSEELAQISVPTTLIWGRHDEANRLRVAEAASARYGWPLRVIEGSADDPARDQPEAFLRALRGAFAES